MCVWRLRDERSSFTWKIVAGDAAFHKRPRRASFSTQQQRSGQGNVCRMSLDEVNVELAGRRARVKALADVRRPAASTQSPRRDARIRWHLWRLRFHQG